MHFIHGEYLVRTRRGRVAWFCPMCGDIQAFRLVARRRVSHVMFVPTGGGELEYWELFCESCGFANIATDVDWIGINEVGKLPLAELTCATNPRIREKVRTQLEAVAAVRGRRAAPGARAYLVRMIVLCAGATGYVHRSIVDLWAGRITLWGSAAVFLAGALLAGLRPTRPEREAGFVTAFAATGIFLVASGVGWIVRRSLVTSRHMLPLAAYGLRSLRVTETDVDTAIRTIRGFGEDVSASLNTRRILAECARREASGADSTP